MIYIPAGSFLMGTPTSYVGTHEESEHPQHSVYLSTYSIGRYEITRGEYREFINAGGYSNRLYWSSEGWSWRVSNNRTEPACWSIYQDWGTGTFVQTDNHPVGGVSYYEAEAFCSWAGGHLPTEAQWEKAARWNASTGYPNAYPWGNAWDAEKGNNYYDTNPSGGGYFKRQTAPVGSYPAGASPYGCQDMTGNVWEWCKDWYGSAYYATSPALDPQGPTSGTCRLLRGGSWCDTCEVNGCTWRNGVNYPYNWGWYGNVGLRLAR